MATESGGDDDGNEATKIAATLLLGFLLHLSSRLLPRHVTRESRDGSEEEESSWESRLGEILSSRDDDRDDNSSPTARLERQASVLFVCYLLLLCTR